MASVRAVRERSSALRNLLNIYDRMLDARKSRVLLVSTLLFVGIAVLDWSVVGEIPLGFLYLLPMAMVGSVLSPALITAAATVCMLLAEMFDDLAWDARTGIPRDVLYFAAFFGVGVFMHEVMRNRRSAMRHLAEVERERDARREAEEQLNALVESSPAAILTADSSGRLLMANEAAHRMFAVPLQQFAGKSVYKYLPSLTNVSRQDASRQLFRTVMQAGAQREDGETFLADICFSTYNTGAGSRLTAMVLDASEELRSHEVSGLHQLMAGSRIAISAVSHEIRNICGAIAVVHRNMANSGQHAGDEDFEALGNLVQALERIAGMNLQQSSDQASEVDVSAVLNELRIIVSPTFQEENIAADWQAQNDLPLAWADRSSLMQVLLNLTTNSTRVLEGKQNARVSITARAEAAKVLIEFEDNGGGVRLPDQLFHPFQAGASATGLGLYLSRAFLRSFGGDLRYGRVGDGACFIVELNASLSPREGQDE